MKINIEAIQQLATQAKRFQEAAEERSKMDAIEKRSKDQLQEIGANPNLRLDDPKVIARIQEPTQWLAIIGPRRKAIEELEKTLRQELKAEFVAQHGALVKVLQGLREARLKEYRDALTPHYHDGSRLQERICREHGPLCDRVQEVNDAIHSIHRWEGREGEARLVENVQVFVRNARRIVEKFGEEIEALGEPQEAVKPRKTHRVRIERMTVDRSSDAEQRQMINTAQPAVIENERYEPGKTYDVDDATYATLKALGNVVDVGFAERAVEAAKNLVK